KAMGYMSAAVSTGLIIGPGIGGFLEVFGSRIPFFAAAIVALIAAIISFFYLQEPIRYKKALIKEKTSELRRVFNPFYFIVFFIIFIASLRLAAFDSLFSLFIDNKLGFTPKV